MLGRPRLCFVDVCCYREGRQTGEDTRDWHSKYGRGQLGGVNDRRSTDLSFLLLKAERSSNQTNRSRDKLLESGWNRDARKSRFESTMRVRDSRHERLTCGFTHAARFEIYSLARSSRGEMRQGRHCNVVARNVQKADTADLGLLDRVERRKMKG